MILERQKAVELGREAVHSTVRPCHLVVLRPFHVHGRAFVVRCCPTPNIFGVISSLVRPCRQSKRFVFSTQMDTAMFVQKTCTWASRMMDSLSLDLVRLQCRHNLLSWSHGPRDRVNYKDTWLVVPFYHE